MVTNKRALVMAEFCRYYAAMGLATFPIWDREKVPRRGSHGHHDATRDPEQFLRLCSRFPDWAVIGIAIRMGDPLPDGGHVVCLDIDEKNGKSGSATLASRRFDLTHTLTANTKSGGLHLLYRSPKPVRTKPGWLHKDSGLDVKGAGGWISAAPTTGYEWLQEPALDLIAPAPEWLLQRTLHPGTGKRPDNSNVVDREMICCPVHDDSTPSLQVTTLKDGRLLYNCFADCPYRDIATIFEEAEAEAGAA